MKEVLPPAPLQRIEKAGIDEVFVDLSAHVHHILLARFPELSPTPGTDPSEGLPPPPVTALDWHSDCLVPLDEAEEVKDPDWDDVALSIGADIVRDIRARVWEKLHYTCSGGISHNKVLSKLGSAHNKPNKQTIIRRRAVTSFLAPIKFTKMRNLGGKLGDQVASEFDTEEINGLLSVPLANLSARLGQETGLWVYNTIRGIDHSEVNSRTKIKSMLSAKSFRPAINTREQAERWIKIFAADIFSRLVEEGILENRRRPKSVNLHLKHNSRTRSRQTSIPPGKSLDQASLVELGNTLLTQIMSEGEVWPCFHLSMNINGIEDGVTGNMGIGGFLVRGNDAPGSKESSTVLRSDQAASSDSKVHIDGGADNSERKRRRSGSERIDQFLGMTSVPSKTSHGDQSRDERRKYYVTDGDGAHGIHPTILEAELDLGRTKCPPIPEASRDLKGHSGRNRLSGEGPALTSDHRCPNRFSQTAADEKDRPALFTCGRCNTSFADPTDLQSHNDWHIALALQEREAQVEERVRSAFAGRLGGDLGQLSSAKSGRRLASGPTTSSSTQSSRRGGGRGTKPRLEPGQKRLNFG